MGKPVVYIDGKEGTTGLQIYDRLAGREDIQLLLIDEDKRKDASERKRLMNEADLVFLCLPDAAAVEAVGLIENDVQRRSLDRVGQSSCRGGLLNLLKPQAGLYPFLLLGNAGLGLLQFVRRLVRTADVLSQPGVSTLGIGELETGIFRLAHRSVPFNFLPGLGVEIAAFSTFFCSNCWRTEGFSCFPRHCSAASFNSSTASSAE